MKNKIINIMLRLPFLLSALFLIGCVAVPVTNAVQIGTNTEHVIALEPIASVRIDPPVVYEEPDYRWDGIGYSVYEDIPLDGHLQYYIQECCAKYNVSYPLVLGLIETESSFRLDADSGWAYGPMQVGYINHDDLSAQGMDPMTTIGNVEAGVYMIGDLLDRYGDVHLALMAYNAGENGAAELWADGITTSQYSRDVLKAARKWDKVINS